MLGSLQAMELLEFYRTARGFAHRVARTYIAPGAPGRACLVTAVVPKLGDDASGLREVLKGLAVTTVRDELSFRAARPMCAKR